MKKLTAFLLCLVLCISLAACDGNDRAGSTTQPGQTTAYTAVDIKIAALKGPTGMGMAKLISDSAKGSTSNNYTFSLESDPTNIAALISSGSVDIAACPLNLAASLYKKTSGAVRMLAVNTLGVLYIVENGKTINSIADLRGKTIYATGQGATPEYILNHILKVNSLEPGQDVTIEYLSEHSELAAKAVSGDADVCMLPEPNVTTALSKNENLRVALDLTQEWKKLNSDRDDELAQGCLVVSTAFAEKNSAAIAKFLEEYKASVDYVNSNAADASVLIAQQEIVPSVQIAKAAIPNCNITFITGSRMKLIAGQNLSVLFDANPKSIGGALPDDNFYYSE